ncbi:MAG: hypothetical protein F6K56_30115 [Moorea sp. SIO3G5]|nr:hypothetical protein [Moorena sp. SIO3G5]
MPIAYCLLPIAYCLLPFAFCLLPIALPYVFAYIKKYFTWPVTLTFLFFLSYSLKQEVFKS